MKKNSKIPVNSPTPSKKVAQSIKKQPVKPLTTKQVPTGTKTTPAPTPAPVRPAATPQKAPQKTSPAAVTPARKGSAPVPKPKPAARPPPQRGPATATGSPPVRPAPIPANSNKPVTTRTTPFSAKTVPKVAPSSVRPAAAPAKQVPAKLGQTAKPIPAKAASAGVPNKAATPPTSKLINQRAPKDTDRTDGRNDGNPQPPKRPSNRISWKKVGREFSYNRRYRLRLHPFRADQISAAIA